MAYHESFYCHFYFLAALQPRALMLALSFVVPFLN
jgi:hypothetical protein